MSPPAGATHALESNGTQTADASAGSTSAASKPRASTARKSPSLAPGSSPALSPKLAPAADSAVLKRPARAKRDATKTAPNKDSANRPMGKQELFQTVAEKAGLLPRDVANTLKILAHVACEELINKKKFILPQLGLFRNIEIPARPGGGQVKMFGKVVEQKARPPMTRIKAYVTSSVRRKCIDGDAGEELTIKVSKRLRVSAAEYGDSSKASEPKAKKQRQRASTEDNVDEELPAPNDDASYKVLRPMHLNLGVAIGSTYTFAELKAKCKGGAAKVKKLIGFTKDPSALAPQ